VLEVYPPLINNNKKMMIAKQQRRAIRRRFTQCQRAGGARHSGAPMLSRYAATPPSLLRMTHLSAVLPALQGR
jgi:hypothetical protein